MLYIISGASRAGKTIIANKLSKKIGIPYLSLDWIMMGFTNGIPEFGIHDKLFPDDIARKLWRFLKAMIESMIFTQTECVIEGEAILPELIIELYQKYPDQIQLCFLGYTDVHIEKKLAEIKRYSHEKNDWLKEESDRYIKDHIQNMIRHSQELKISCDQFNLKYIDISNKFMDVAEETIEYLLKHET